MKRFLWITLCLCITLAALAQKQQGIVRTIERPGQKSTGISGVTVKINEYPNAIVSGKGGKFSFTLQGKKQGDRCLVTSVTKKGYTLIDKMPTFAYSFSTPAEIVMVSNKQLQQDEKRIREKAEKKAAATYEKRLAELERQLQEKTISEESYREQLQQVFDGHESFLKMIDEMARRYATTDYKGISEINRQIQECIENAELERADSLINSKGDLNQRKKELEEKRDVKQKIDSLSLALQEVIDFSTNELANDFYTKHLICASRYDNDSAAYYLIERVKLDTTNVEWLCSAGIYIDDYIDDKPLAIQYFQKCVEQVKKRSGEESDELCSLYNLIGKSHSMLGNDSIALYYYNKALSLTREDNSTRANIIGNIGLLYSGKDDYSRALDYYYQSLEIRQSIFEDDDPSIANSYNNIGLIYYVKQDFQQALNYFSMALDIRERILSPNDPAIAISYNNIGAVYDDLEDYDMALVYYLKALVIQERVLGNNHTIIASTYNNIGLVYKRQKNFEKAKEYYSKSLQIYKKNIGVNHPLLGTVYNNLGSICEDSGEADQAKSFYFEALKIQENSLGTNHTTTAITYNNIGGFIKSQKEYAKALEYFTKAYEIFRTKLGEKHFYTQSVMRNINSIQEIFDDNSTPKD